MTDSEKLALISTLITDYWEYHNEEQRKDGAECIITAISTITDFKGEEK